MHRFKRIVVATDLSSESLGVVSYAGHLARDADGELTIVHAAPSVSLADYTKLVPARDLDLVDHELLEHARSTLDGWARRHLKKLNEVDIVVEQGAIVQVVCNVAADVDADVLVVASHGRDGLSRLVLGSVTEKLIRESPCPVLVIKPPTATDATSPSAGGKVRKPKSESAAAIGDPTKETNGASA
jgi:nucleotide-binding universal stress UspA family protein